MGTTLQARIDSTQDVNKESYLKAIADRIISNPGTPVDWGVSVNVPADFGLAATSSMVTYELDKDKISRLNALNNASLSYLDLVSATKLNNIAVGISVSQLMTVNIAQLSNSTVGGETSFTFTVSTSIDSKPTSANLQCRLIADSYTAAVIDTTVSGVGDITMQFPTALVDDALLVVFARAPFDQRITSYAIYNFADSTQEVTPSNTTLSLSPLDNILSFDASAGVTVESIYVLTYSYEQEITSIQGSHCGIPQLIDNSPLVLVACGHDNGDYFEEWTAYPQMPLNAGSTFEGSERNICSYLVTVDGVLYKLELSLGDVNY